MMLLDKTSATLKQWASFEPGSVEKVLRIASFARTNDFDLLSDEGWALLRKEVCKDFPDLTLPDLSQIIMRGIKGKISTPYASSSLNFTRIYQWIEMEVSSRRSEFAIPQSPDAYRYEIKPELKAQQDAEEQARRDAIMQERLAKHQQEQQQTA